MKNKSSLFKRLIAASIAVIVLIPALDRFAHAENEPAPLSEQSHLGEIGVFVGPSFLPTRHELFDPDLTHKTFKKVAPEIGLRIAYLPLIYFGLEVEAALLPTKAGDETALIYGVRGHLLGQYPVWRGLTPFVLAGGGFLGVSSSEDGVGNDIDWSVHWGVGMKYYFSRWVAARLDFRHTISDGLENKPAHHFSLLAGLSLVLGRKAGVPAQPSPPDRDGDGIPDHEDECPDEPGVPPHGCPDRDGDGIPDHRDECPDEPGVPPHGCPDRDGDGIPDHKDECPDEPGVPPHGCPDRDGDGIPDHRDECPDKPGDPPHGCPDTDGDGIPDHLDQCPEVPGVPPHGCPEEVQRFTGTIQGIVFALNSAAIRPKSFAVLNKAVEVLKKYPDLRIKIDGHTDDTGRRSRNMRLSQARADSVKKYLVGKGISEDRIETEGFGPDKPVDPARTGRARARNRRIEFSIIK